MALKIVWNAVMPMAADGRLVPPLEDALLDGRESETAERFLRLASGELDRAYRLAGLVLGSQNDAEDATQDALLRAWRSAASLRDPAGFQAWFDRILVNVCRDRLRRQGKVLLLALDEADAVRVERDPFRVLLDRDEALRTIGTLEDDERIVVVLHYWADLTLESVAERIGIPVGTAKSRLHRALVTMRQATAVSTVVEVRR